MEPIYVAYVLRWVECESVTKSFLSSKKDGFSLHPSRDSVLDYIKDYWDGMPDKPPKIYSKPSGEPYPCQIDEQTAKSLDRAGDGMRFARGQRKLPKPL